MDWSLHWRRHTPDFSTDTLVDVNPQEALPHRDVSTERPHLPGASNISEHPDARTSAIAHLAHLYKMRTHPELFFEDDVDTAIAAWQHLARTDNRGLYDCHTCRVTWTILFDADTCPAGHPILED